MLNGKKIYMRNYMKNYRLKYNKKLNKYRRKYYQENKQRIFELYKRYCAKNRIKLLENKKVQRNSLKGKYSEYKQSAKKRKIDFSLTIEEFKQLWQIPCTYCGINIKTIGIDRVDSKKGYQVNNIISCCTDCNKIKNSKTLNNFIKHCKQCKKIWDFWGSKNIIPPKI